MEIPARLKRLYLHWSHHTRPLPAVSLPKGFNQEVYRCMADWATQRMCIWQRKVAGQAPPHTPDTVFQRYRFCNVYRELDRQTIELHALLKPVVKNLDLWLLNTLFYRFVCRPETIKRVGLLSFDRRRNRRVWQNLIKLPRPKYGTAYVFPVNLLIRSRYPDRETFFCYRLPQVAGKCAAVITSFDRTGVAEAIERILPVFGFNFRFHLTEALIDVAYQYPECIDLFKLFPAGPGSRPIMRQLNPSLNPEQTCLALVSTTPANFPYLTYEGKRVYLSAENWEGIGCEWRKYSNLRSGTGRRRRYHPR